MGFQQHWRLLSSVPFLVALRSLDVAPQREVLSAISNPVVVTGLGRVLCIGIMGGQGRLVTLSILLDRRSAILAHRIFLCCCPFLMVVAKKVDWQREVQGFVPFSGVSKLHVAIKGGWHWQPPKSRVYYLVPRSFANHVWAWALFWARVW